MGERQDGEVEETGEAWLHLVGICDYDEERKKERKECLWLRSGHGTERNGKWKNENDLRARTRSGTVQLPPLAEGAGGRDTARARARTT